MLRWGIAAIICTWASYSQANAQQLYSNEQGSGAERCRQVSAEKLANDPSYAREMAWDRMVFGAEVHPCGVRLEPFDPGTWERTPPLKATDSQGRTSDFRLYVLDERFSWVFGSSEGLETTDQGPTRFRDIFTRPLFLQEFCSADSVIGIGAASHEGAIEPNRQLADRRASTIASELASVGALCETNAAPPIYALNLGKHRNQSGCTSASNCGASTSPQRRLVIVAAESAEEGANIEEAMRDVLERTRIINTFAIADYHDFLVERHAPGGL